jgi:hypothetical protein
MSTYGPVSPQFDGPITAVSMRGGWPVILKFDPSHFVGTDGTIILSDNGVYLTKKEAEHLLFSLQAALEDPRAYAEVTLLDAKGFAPDRAAPTSGPWTYENPDGYDVGEYVFVPFGPSNKLCVAKITGTSSRPSYTGLCKIKAIDGKAISENEGI